MKKHSILLLTLLTFILFGGAVYAQEATMLNNVYVVFDITASTGNADLIANVQLSDETTTYDAQLTVGADTTKIVAQFDVQPYEAGKKFVLSVKDGFDSIQYYNQTYKAGENVELQTYTYLDNNTPVRVNTFHLHAIPSITKRIEFYKDYNRIQLQPEPRYYDGVLYVPAAAGANSMDISHIEYDIDSGKITYWILESPIILHVGSKNVVAFGQYHTLEREVITINEIPYIPLISFANIVDAWHLIQYEPDHINVVVSGSNAVKREILNYEKNNYINSANLYSQTDYLIYVSKGDYTVRVYQGYANNWTLIKSLPCAVGKLNTPTCVGTFKYYERINKWSYSKYYVAPVMRFNKGYALHSTLINYNGTPYDDRVGMNLSAGCVRLHPSDMNWLFNLIPLHTTVHVTDY